MDNKLFDCETHECVKKYLSYRYAELASIGIKVVDEVLMDYGIMTIYNNGYCSIYILKQHRGKQYFIKTLQKFMLPIITMENCNIIDYLNKIRCNYIVVKPSFAYCIISKHYGDKTARRSGVKLMNHIDEGLKILLDIGVKDTDVLDAYCLHPLFQSDANLSLILTNNKTFEGVSQRAIILAMEYRRVANSYLSSNNIENFVGFGFPEIKQMLYADKVQNEKDFKLYHEDTHPKSKELRQYFNNWLNILLK